MTDGNYLRHAMHYYPRKIMMLRNMTRLEQYHLGRQVDFTGERKAGIIHIVTYAYKYSPYYRKLFADAKVNMSDIISQFERIPLLDKSIIRKSANDIVSTELHKMIYGTRNTGGSTGEPLEFQTSVNFDTEHQAFLYRLMGYQHGERILAMDGSSISSASINNNIYWTKKSDREVPYGSMALSSLYLNNHTMPYYVDYIKAFKPVVIRGYPAFVNEIALYMTKNRMNLHHVVKGVVLTSESANRPQIDDIANAFNSRVFLQYGHSEASLFGYTIDGSYEYYCSPFYGYVEVVNESGEHVGPGEMGEVVCTGFYNYAMPFIRYKTGDLAVFLEDRDGIVRLKSVLGRTQDYVYGSDLTKTLLTALVFGLHYRAFANIKKWQIIQDRPGEVTVSIVKDKPFSSMDEEEIRLNFLNIAKVATKFEYVEAIPLTKRGKSRFLVQNIGSS